MKPFTNKQQESYESIKIWSIFKKNSKIKKLMIKTIEKLMTNVILLVNTEGLHLAYVI